MAVVWKHRNREKLSDREHGVHRALPNQPSVISVPYVAIQE